MIKAPDGDEIPFSLLLRLLLKDASYSSGFLMRCFLQKKVFVAECPL
jgi:hypothetical protein